LKCICSDVIRIQRKNVPPPAMPASAAASTAAPDVTAAPPPVMPEAASAPTPDVTTTRIQSIVKDIQQHDDETREEILNFFSALKYYFHVQASADTLLLIKEKIREYLEKIRFTQIDEMMLGGIKSATHATTYLAALEGVPLATEAENKNQSVVAVLRISEIKQSNRTGARDEKNFSRI